MVEANFPDGQIVAPCNHGVGAITGFQSVQEQVKVQAIPEVQVIERIQEQIVPDRIEEQIRDIPVHPNAEVVQVLLLERLQQRIVEQMDNAPVSQVVAVTSERVRAHSCCAHINSF